MGELIMTISRRRFNRNALDFDKVELLKGLDVNTRYKIMKSIVMHRFIKGDVIFRKGSTGQSLFFAQDGIIDVVAGNDDFDPNDPSSCLVDQIMPWAVFGEMALSNCQCQEPPRFVPKPKLVLQSFKGVTLRRQPKDRGFSMNDY